MSGSARVAVSIGEAETEALEFKRSAWTEAKEAAKDIAAMANRSGGRIVLGVEEVDGRASRYATWADASGEDATILRLKSAVGALLRPRDVVDAVLMTPEPNGIGGTLCVIRVPASAVLVAVADGAVETRLSFPIRAERGTRYMPYDEIVDRLFGSERTAQLRVERELARPGQHRVHFVAPILFHTERSRGPAIDVPGMHGELDRLEPGGFIVRMGSVNRSYRDVRGSQTDAPECSLAGYELFVPYALTTMVTAQPGGGVFIDLRASIVWWGAGWSLAAR